MLSKRNNEQDAMVGLDKIIDNTFDKIKKIVDANTTIGSIIKLTDKIFIVPISKINVGLVSGGGEFPNKKNKNGMSAGSSSGFTITPMGFIVVNENLVNFIASNHAENNTNKLLETILNMTEKILSKQGVNNEEN